MSKIDYSLFTGSKQAVKNAYGDCPLCGGELGIKRGKNGAFLGCRNYPTCSYIKPLSTLPSNDVIKEIDGSSCPECSEKLVVKKGRFGLFIGCSNFPECHYIKPINESDDTELTCPACKKGQLVLRKNKYGKRFFACNQYPKCRYLLNSQPVSGSCPKCGWQVLVEKKQGNARVLACPQKGCGYKSSQVE